MKTRRCLVLLLCALAGTPAQGNDTSSQLAAGGLVLTRSDTVEMEAEDLYISREAVRVRYRFRNTSAHDTTMRVAFPMPDIGGPGFFMRDVSIPVEAPANVLGFETVVKGKLVHTALEQKAMVGTVDHSAWLTGHQIPLSPHLSETDTALSHLTEAQRAQATKLGLIDDDGSPAWVLRSTYHWLQTFPAGEPVTIEHRYKPSVGGTVMTGVGQDPDDETARTYCVEPDILRMLDRSTTRDGGPRYSEQWLDYILVTGGNWKKPIGDFRLVVDKGKPSTLVSFCSDGVRKIGPTTFEMRKRYWRPEKDLKILFLEPFEEQ